MFKNQVPRQRRASGPPCGRLPKAPQPLTVGLTDGEAKSTPSPLRAAAVPPASPCSNQPDFIVHGDMCGWFTHIHRRTFSSHLQSTDRSVLAVGPRQAGKSTLLSSLEPDLAPNLANPGVSLDDVSQPERPAAVRRSFD